MHTAHKDVIDSLNDQTDEVLKKFREDSAHAITLFSVTFFGIMVLLGLNFSDMMSPISEGVSGSNWGPITLLPLFAVAAILFLLLKVRKRYEEIKTEQTDFLKEAVSVLNDVFGHREKIEIEIVDGAPAVVSS